MPSGAMLLGPTSSADVQEQAVTTNQLTQEQAVTTLLPVPSLHWRSC
jgi:hypothetical protein